MSRLRVGAGAQVKVGVQASPGLKLLARMLELSAQEMEQLLAQELEENPALELTEDAKPFHTPFQPVLISYEVAEPEDEPGETVAEEDTDSWLTTPPLQLKEHVREQLRLSLSPELHPIADYLVESLDERGYLNTDIEEVALQLECTPEAVEQVLRQLQQCDPPGVGARNLQECLLLQLSALMGEQEDPERLVSIAYRIVKDAWGDFSRVHFDRVARRLRLDEATVREAHQFIRRELRPYPAEGFQEARFASQETPPLEPDIIIRYKKPEGLTVELRGPSPDIVRLSPSYAEQYLVMRQQTRHVTHEEREHIFQYVSRARLFLQALHQRQQTLKRIVEVLVERQFSFLFTSDPRFLQPMTRAELAEATRLHRSTIGRAVRNKWLQLPCGTLVPLDIFFDASYRVALFIQQIIDEHEGGERYLTDADIAQQLAEMGIHIARRTVSKYRNRHKILSSRWRERARRIG
ncbi:MAG: RNA polymerase factor sigma-54 [Fimbriimonadales bacterium]|nr:RNA polymerase factor sigma-54 [Fimbriimonadales bacterium]